MAAQGGGFIDTILNLIPGRKQQASTEPTEDSIKKTHDYLRQAALLPAVMHLRVYAAQVAALVCHSRHLLTPLRTGGGLL